MKLSDAQMHWLRWLHKNGGSAYIDGHHMYAQGERTKMGSEIAWLQLVIKGCIEAKNQRFVITDYGFRHLGLHQRSEVMNPPASAAEGAEARNLNTEPCHGTGAVPRGAEARPADASPPPSSQSEGTR